MSLRPTRMAPLLTAALVLGATAAVGLAAEATSHSRTRWTMTALADWGTDADAINDRGQVAGSFEGTAWVWEKGRLRALDQLTGHESHLPRDLNNAGRIVGTAARYVIRDSVEVEEEQAVEWRGVTARAVAGRRSAASEIDDRNRIVGRVLSREGRSRAFLWSGGTERLLPTPAERESRATAINALGRVVGVTWRGAAGRRAVVWQDGRRIVLRGLGGGESAAIDLNDRGGIVGWSETKDGTRHATLWQSGRPSDLGSTFDPSAINNHGQVVGTCGRRACIWQNGELTTLPSAGYRQSEASDVNDAGVVVGSVTDDLRGEGRPMQMAVLWTKRG